MKNKAIIPFLAITVILLLSSCSHNSETGPEHLVSNHNTKSSSVLNSISSSIPLDYYPQEWKPATDREPVSWDDLAKDPPPKREVEEVIDEIPVDGAGKDQMPIITNETPLHELMSEINPLTVMAINANCDIRYIAEPYHISQVIDHLPVSFLRKTDEGCYYTVNKLVEGGYVYIFFERERDLQTGNYTTDDMTDVYATGCIYAEKRLEKSDFNNVKIGDSIEKVIAIDHAAFITKQWAEWNEDLSIERTNILISKHLLTDGLLAITYAYNGDELVVRNMAFSSEFVFISPYLQQENIEYPKLFKILPQDYPPV